MKLSVCILTYNHAPYIRQCIESALAQKANFDFEIVIGDDASTDGTTEICSEYASKFPNVRHIVQDKSNKIYINGRPTGRYNFISLLKIMNGEYIAMLDGDDYWNDANKIQMAVDFLEKNEKYSFTFHRCYVNKDGNINNDYVNDNTPETIDLEYLAKNGNCIRTLSVVFRNVYHTDIPDVFFHTSVGDYPLHVNNARYGMGKYFGETLGVYRKHAGGIWNSYKNIDMIREWYVMIEMLSKEYHGATLEAWKIQMTKVAFTLAGKYKEIDEHEESEKYLKIAKSKNSVLFEELLRSKTGKTKKRWLSYIFRRFFKHG